MLKKNKLYQDDYQPYRNKVRLMDKDKQQTMNSSGNNNTRIGGNSFKIRSEKLISPRNT